MNWASQISLITYHFLAIHTLGNQGLVVENQLETWGGGHFFFETWLLSLFLEMVQLFLSCTEIKWYYVEGNSKGVSIVLKCWIDDFVVLGREIPDFRFQITEQNIFKRNENF